MSKFLSRPMAAAGLGLALLSALSAPAGAQRASGDVSAILFEGEHFKAAPPTATLRYAYKRATKGADGTGPAFEDRITLKLAPGDAPEKRDIIVTLFESPAHHRPAGPFDDNSFNPVVILVLEHHLGNLAKILKGNPRYFKNAIRAGLRDRATATPVKISVGGREVDATRISVAPFEKDPQKERFGPFAATTYDITWSDAVPGLVYRIQIATPDPTGGAPLVEEDTRYVEN